MGGHRAGNRGGNGAVSVGESGFEPRAVCLRCRRPARVCWCAEVPSLPTKTRVLLLQHPRERDMPIGTARMASLCLPNSELHVGIDFESSSALGRALRDPERPAMLLYPADDAVDVRTEPPKGPITLVVVDGTWWQARKLVRANPSLAALPKLAFTPDAPSEYRIRREPLPSYVSTIEALVHVLSALEDEPARFEAMLAPFRKMIDMQLEHARLLQGARTRHAKGPKPPKPDAIARLRERARSLVCVMAEANAWPFVPGGRRTYPDELVYWTAYRPSTGERFERVVAPVRELSPFTSEHIGLSEPVLRAGNTKEALFSEWNDFIHDTDVVCSWGPYATRLFLREGGRLPARRIDIRRIARDQARGNVGTMDDVLEELEGTDAPSLARGRGGERLGKLAAIVRRYTGLDGAREEPSISG